MTRPITLLLHPKAVAHNFAVIKARAQKPLMTVIKANAYGHGVEFILSVLRTHLRGADMLALLEFERAQELRQHLDWQGAILMLEGAFEYADVIQAAELQLDLMVHQTQQIEWLEALNKSATRYAPLRIHLKLNSGMNRLGFTPADYRLAYARLAALPGVKAIVHTTHFANADQVGGAAFPSLAHQLKVFNETTANLAGARSLANSAAIFRAEPISADWARAGIALYGAHPAQNGSSARDLNLLATQTLSAQIIALQKVGAGETVGYGGQFRAEKESLIAVISCGYADGYPRHARTGTPVEIWHQGVMRRVPLVGRVSMDMLTVDVSTLPEVTLGTPVELWGVHLPIDEVAQHADTIAYELMCAVAPRVRRQVTGA